MGVDQQYPRFNLYDIFATFLPGVVLLTGVFLPVIGVRGLLVELKIGSILILIVLSFAAGLALQIIGGFVSSASAAFEDHMEAVVHDQRTDEDKKESLDNTSITVSPVDILFLERCRSEFELSAKFNDWKRLYKLVLSKLELPSQSRALRIQALYLGIRGMTVTMLILTIYYLLTLLGTIKWEIESALPDWTLVAFTGVTLALGLLFYIRQEEFREDVVQYLVNDYCVVTGDIE